MNAGDFEFFFNQMNHNNHNFEQESAMAEIADLFYRIFQSLQIVGFEREEALEILLAIICAGGNN